MGIVGWAGLTATSSCAFFFAEGTFLAAGVLGIAVSLSTIPTAGGLALGPVWLTMTPKSIMLAVRLLMRSLGCAAAMNFLALTTPLVDLIDLLRRMRVSELLIDLMTLIYRFVFTLTDCLERMVLAQKMRMGFNGWRNSLRSMGRIGANLFIEAYRHSQRLQTALEGRGWEGTLRVLPQQYERPEVAMEKVIADLRWDLQLASFVLLVMRQCFHEIQGQSRNLTNPCFIPAVFPA